MANFDPVSLADKESKLVTDQNLRNDPFIIDATGTVAVTVRVTPDAPWRDMGTVSNTVMAFDAPCGVSGLKLTASGGAAQVFIRN